MTITVARATLALCLATGAMGFSAPSVSRLPMTSLKGSQSRAAAASSISALSMSGAAPKKSASALTTQVRAAFESASTKLVPAYAAFTSLFGIASGLPAALVVSLIASSVGFISAVYFVGYGYALSMIALGSVALRQYMPTASQFAVYHAAAVVAWGARILVFLLYREFYAWKQLRERNMETNKKFAPTAKVSTWLFVSVFYSLLFTPVLFHLQTASTIPLLTKTGLGVAAVGLVLESQSDSAKSSFKKKTPSSFMSTGLYRLCRHPNYLGEIIFWAGSYMAGVGSLTSPLKWTSASLGMAGIIAIMLQATESLEKKQALKYVKVEGYKEYVAKTPKLLPFTSGDDLEEILEAAKKAKDAKVKSVAAAKDKAVKDQEAKDNDAKDKESKGKGPAGVPAAAKKAAPETPSVKIIGTNESPYLKNKKPWDT
eukprot:CAMPEP_0173394964 /NCGR_PEP_ID=MMETSP1356-20130122/30334_1 /TAXON_ID=77927 ORGANISM="Hemiselmis virescens, Strain PCC157" /NCGR_SAMPLE_ID=MMETSP1356 /ASSEMBLY_ACC=CAM_ASM_000847 /LENGTH=428 /DNA_ID=CAMNT_0014353553 /DNA_START=46 /DNA_END=1332 /DNA_ORIENTATION=-